MRKLCFVTQEKELRNCDFVKMCLMIMVLIYHCCVFWTGEWFTRNPIIASPALKLLSKWLNSFHIYSFFLVSGYLFYYVKYERNKRYNFLIFLKNKIQRLIVPYAFILFFWVIPFAILFMTYGIDTILVKYILGVGPNQLWFLLVLFWIQLLSFWVSDYWEKSKLISIIMLVFMYVVGNFFEEHFMNVFQIFTALRCWIFFALGFMIRGNCTFRSLIYKIPMYVHLLFNICLFIVVIYISESGGNSLIKLFIEFFLRIHGAITAFVVIQKLIAPFAWKKNRIFSVISECTMPLYLVHQQVVYILIVLLNGCVSPIAHALINIIVVFTFSYIIARVLMHFKITRFLVGEK